jgi:hypothetical protein
MASVITSEFAKASERSSASPFCLIERRVCWQGWAGAFSRGKRPFHDPRGFFRDLTSPADTKDLKRRRLVYVGLGCALVAHAVLLTLMVVAGWHRVLASPKQEDPELVVKSWVPPPSKSDTPVPDKPKEDAPKGDLHHGGGGGGQNDQTPVPKGPLLPSLPTPTVVKFNAPPGESQLPAVTARSGTRRAAPPPDPPGDRTANRGRFRAGRRW